MLGGIFWVLLVVAVWATIFISSLLFGREMARSHDREALREIEADRTSGVADEATHVTAKAS